MAAGKCNLRIVLALVGHLKRGKLRMTLITAWARTCNCGEAPLELADLIPEVDGEFLTGAGEGAEVSVPRAGDEDDDRVRLDFDCDWEMFANGGGDADPVER